MSNQQADSDDTTTGAVLTLFQSIAGLPHHPRRMTSQTVYDTLVEQQKIPDQLPIANVRSSIHQLEKRRLLKRLPVSETGPLGHRMKLYILAPQPPLEPSTL